MLQKFLFVRHSFKLLPRLTISPPSRVEIIHRWSHPLYRVSSPAHTCACACGFVARYSRVEREREREMARYSSSTILLSSDYIGQWVHFRKWSGNCASQRDRDGARSHVRRRLREKCNFGHHQGGSRKLKGSIVRDLYAIQRFSCFSC